MNTQQPDLDFLNEQPKETMMFAIPNEKRFIHPIAKAIETAHKSNTCKVMKTKETKTKITYKVEALGKYQIAQILFSLGMNFGYYIKENNVAIREDVINN